MLAEGSLVKARDLEKIEEGWHLITWPSRAAVKEDYWPGGKSIAGKIFSSHQTPLRSPDWTPGEPAAGIATSCRACGGEASRRPGPGRRPAGTLGHLPPASVGDFKLGSSYRSAFPPIITKLRVVID